MMWLFFTVIILIAFIFLFQWRHKSLTLIANSQFSHFSDLGFRDFHNQEVFNQWANKIKMEGQPYPDRFLWEWKEPSGISLLAIELEDGLVDIIPFFKGNIISIVTKEIHQQGWIEFTTSQWGQVMAEWIPTVDQPTDQLELVAFGSEVTLYDSPEFYGQHLKTSFKKQIISVQAAMKDDNKWQPSGDIIVSGIVKYYHRYINSETGHPFICVEILTQNDEVITAVWDERMTDRFPQIGNVVVGNFYLIAKSI